MKHKGYSSEFLRGELNKFITILSLIYWAYIIYYAATFGIPRPKYTVMYVGGGVVIYGLARVSSLLADQKLLLSLATGILTLILFFISLYIFFNFIELYYERSLTVYWYEFVFAIALLLILSYFSYLEFGKGFVVLSVLVVAYSYFGPQMPGILVHGGLSVDRLVNTLVLDIRGIYGSISRIVAAWVALFLLYAGLLRGYGAFDLIKRIAYRARAIVSSGVAQSAVIASILIGSINGSQTANAAMTGSFTIPMMKDSGIRPRTAAGIEAVASSGGQIMPPVMGAAAFVMASILGITYLDVVVAGIIPGVIFFISVAIAVHYASLRSDLTVNADSDSPEFDPLSYTDITFELVKYGIPFISLIYLLGVVQWTVSRSALSACLIMIVTGTSIPMLQSVYRNDLELSSVGVEVVKETVEGFRYGAITMAPIVIIIAVINGIVDLLLATGIPGVVSLSIMELSGGILIFAALAAMIVCIVLGLGMPTVAAYTLVAILIAPTFVTEFLLPELSAHYFVFYAAILSGITPPIAVSVVVTAGIAGSNFWYSSYESLKIATALFILPFSFIYNPELVVGGFTFETIVTAIIVLSGASLLTHGLNFISNLNKIFDYVLRFVYLILGAFIMVYPDNLISMMAIFVGLALAVAQNFNKVHTALVSFKYS